MAQSNTASPGDTIAAPSILGVALIALALLSTLFLLQENGLALPQGTAHYLHELTHDARHALGVPCH